MHVIGAGVRTPLGGPSVVAVGRFDGVHIGHRAVLERARSLATELGARVGVVVTPPVVAPPDAARVITPLDVKLELLAGAGVEVAVVLDGRPTGEPPDELVDERPNELVDKLADQLLHELADVLAVTLRAAVVVAGAPAPASAPGREALRPAVPVALVPTVRHPSPTGSADATTPSPRGTDADVVSAERIIDLVSEGAVEEAAVLLGRPHAVRGLVDHGDARGRELGFPTANIGIPAHVALPADGVYAGHYVRPDGKSWASAISLGRRPTFYAERGARLLEAYLLDFDGDLYDEVGTVQFERLLRPQERFDSVDALIIQLRHDVEATASVLGAPRRDSSLGR